MIVQLSSSMTGAMLDKFLKAYDELDESEGMLIYFASGGGSLYVMDILIDIIHKMPDRFEIIFVDHIFSAAAILALSLKCKKSMLPGTLAMLHNPRLSEISVDLQGNILDGYKDFLDKSTVNKYLKLYRECGMSEEDIKRIKNGEDVYYKYSSFKHLFNSSKTI